MSDRYKQVKLYDNFKFCPVCPVDILKGAIYIDNLTSKAVFQLKFVNMQNKIIKAVYIQVKGYNDLKEKLVDKEYQYLDLKVCQSQEFGTEQLKELDNNTVRNIDITINKVIYENDEIWENKNTVVYDRTSLNLIDSNLSFVAKMKATEQGLQFNNTYYPTENKNYWTCVCGTYNSSDNDKCYKCMCNKKIVMNYFSRQQLENYLEQYNHQQEIQRLETEKKKKTMKNKVKSILGKTLIIAFILCIVILIYTIAYKHMSVYSKYMKAQKYIENNNYVEAINILNEIIDYKDSKELIKSILEQQRNKQIDNSSISVYRSNKDDECKIVAVKSNGTVVATGKNKYGECNVSEWTDIVSVSTNVNHTVGLRSDGTVVATGSNDNNQCDVSEWKDIVKVVASIRATYGLTNNGTIISTEKKFENITNWKDVIDIKVSGSLIYGLTSYGKILKSGQENPKLEMYDNIVNINMNNLGLIATKVNGSIARLYVEKMEEYSGTGYLDWKNVIYTNNEIGIIGIDNKGKVLYTTKVREPESIKDWKNLIYISLYENSYDNIFYYVGITKDGQILTNRNHSIINFDKFTDLKIVSDNKDKIF